MVLMIGIIPAIMQKRMKCFVVKAGEGVRVSVLVFWKKQIQKGENSRDGRGEKIIFHGCCKSMLHMAS